MMCNNQTCPLTSRECILCHFIFVAPQCFQLLMIICTHFTFITKFAAPVIWILGHIAVSVKIWLNVQPNSVQLPVKMQIFAVDALNKWYNRVMNYESWFQFVEKWKVWSENIRIVSFETVWGRAGVAWLRCAPTYRLVFFFLLWMSHGTWGLSTRPIPPERHSMETPGVPACTSVIRISVLSRW